jgi:hypothetical protein
VWKLKFRQEKTINFWRKWCESQNSKQRINWDVFPAYTQLGVVQQESAVPWRTIRHTLAIRWWCVWLETLVQIWWPVFLISLRDWLQDVSIMRSLLLRFYLDVSELSQNLHHHFTSTSASSKSNSSGGLQIEASKTYLHDHLQKIEAQD